MKLDFASALSNLRRENNLSQKKAADELGISQALLSHYENGIREPKLEFIVRACDFYGVSTDYILGRTTEKAFGGVTLRCSTEEHVRSAEAGSLVISMLADIGDEALSAAAAQYMNFNIFIILSALRATRRPYEPLFEAALKTAEAVFLEKARRINADGGMSEMLSDEALKARYPAQFEAVRALEELINKAVANLKLSSIGG